MIKNNYMMVQNGSDIRGVAMEVSGGMPVNLTGEITSSIAASFAAWLGAKLDKPICALRIGIGRDSRLTGPALAGGITDGLSRMGVSVFDCALASTPAMFMGTVFEETGFDGAIMVTASHLPMERNGMKFFTRAGGLDREDITAILEGAAQAPSCKVDKTATPYKSLLTSKPITQPTTQPDNA